MYIQRISAISHQPVFHNPGFSASITPLEKNSTILHPDYSGFIAPMDRRRMTDVQKMAITCALDCTGINEKIQPDAIIMGTSMGCCKHTRQFLDVIHQSDGGLLSPTSFILSPHNTLAGQISLLLGNHNYNMTHTHNSLSFEQALVDAQLCLDEGSELVLAGAADEVEGALYDMDARLNVENSVYAAGAASLLLSRSENPESCLSISAVEFHVRVDDPVETTNSFLHKNKINPLDISHVLFSDTHQNLSDTLTQIFPAAGVTDYNAIFGTFFTQSALALSMAADILQSSSSAGQRHILIYNNLIPENLGLILISKNP